MKLRPPAVPLITIDPYFSVWSPADKLTDAGTEHWTGKPNTILGTATIDGVDYQFIGVNSKNLPKMEQVSLNVTALSTEYKFSAGGIELTALFTTPLLPDDYYYLTRPISYLKVNYRSLDENKHEVKVKVAVSEEICLDYRGFGEVETEILDLGEIKSAKIGNKVQRVLNRDGDDVRIDWGYFYLSVKEGVAGVEEIPIAFRDGIRHGPNLYMTFVTAEKEIACPKCGAMFTFAYDDVESMVYFGDHLKTWWNKDGAVITDEIVKAFGDYCEVKEKADAFSAKLYEDAEKAGGKKYAEMLELAYRQVIAAHKLVLDKEGKILFISKECFSNGCAATVDVSYPSIPMFLLYNPELVAGMMRPIYRYARSDEWAKVLQYDFAPHDCGRFPFVNGQVYARNRREGQMPVEECGNMIVMAATHAIASGDVTFAKDNLDLLEKWADYLIKYGADPENQLCTDDFAGHLAHNTNLSLKAISGLIGLSIIYKMLGDEDNRAKYIKVAKEFADDWVVRAANGDGSFRLAYDRPGTFSMKYNIVWDKLFGTNIMNKDAIRSEFESYKEHMYPYGLPLDNRQPYTKSDWYVWTGTLADTKEQFEEFIEPLWKAYNFMETRVPMTDWYWNVTGSMRGFRHRSVQGGLFIKLLEASGKMKVE
ncbi:MAG: DUF4965 domain-containing protein [Clostridia bacterium]|nr:DUF4965 domain-containing protein [Clostridia bacterium]